MSHEELEARLLDAPPPFAAHQDLALALADAPAGTGGVIRTLMARAGAGFVRVALWAIAHPGAVAAVAAEAAAGQYGKALEDAIAALKGAMPTPAAAPASPAP